jgi:hypothetical protein
MSNLSVEWQDRVSAWIADGANKGISKPGDDRTPAWGWLGRLYYDGGLIVMPADNLNACFADAGRCIPLGKGTYQRVVCAGMQVKEFYWPMMVDGKTIKSQQFLDLIDKGDTKEDHQKRHCSLASKNGFDLWPKHAALGDGKGGVKKVIRVRPRFNKWSLQGTIDVFDDRLTPDIVKQILTFAGTRVGLGDWRPSAPKKPGHYGLFDVEISPIKAAKATKSNK